MEDILILLGSYDNSANLVGFYWHFYAVIALGVVTIIFGRAEGNVPSRQLRLILLVGFAFFAFASLSALINKHGIHAALAHEIAARVGDLSVGQGLFLTQELTTKLSVACDTPFPMRCLHATDPWKPVVMHVVLDIAICIAILFGRRHA